MPVSTSMASLSGPRMDIQLMEAAMSGNSTYMASQHENILLGITPQGNTCLHISSIHGHQPFCTDVVAREESLLSATNLDGETPLLAAVRSGRDSLASILLPCYRARQLSEAILKQDIDGCNALHHAIRGCHRELALQLIIAEPTLSTQLNRMNESPMYIAAMRDFTDISKILLDTPDSAHMGPCDYNALQAAVRNGNADLAKKIMAKRPGMARQADSSGSTPLGLALYRDQIDVVRVLLGHDCSLGYEVPSNGIPLLSIAARGGHIKVVEVLLNHCPDTPYRGGTEDKFRTSLHTAVSEYQVEFTKFIVRTPQLRKLINIQDEEGKTALHYAVQKCNPEMVAALLSHKDIDTTMLDKQCDSPAWELLRSANHAKTLNWNEVIILMLRADRQDTTTLNNLHMRTKQKAIEASREDAKSLMKTYTSNTSLVAILIVTITFAAAFTLPGGYSNNAGTEGLPVMSKKFAFKAFLISDVLALCSSFVVAFICIIARWEDYEFLIYYRSVTKKLMWFAYVTTTTAFSTGLYTMLAPRLHWLAIAICVMVALLPILTMLLGRWPVWKLRLRLGKDFNSDLLAMV